LMSPRLARIARGGRRALTTARRANRGIRAVWTCDV
jgi:hypothetical protein